MFHDDLLRNIKILKLSKHGCSFLNVDVSLTSAEGWYTFLSLHYQYYPIVKIMYWTYLDSSLLTE